MITPTPTTHSPSRPELSRCSPRSQPYTLSFTMPVRLSWALAGRCEKNVRKNEMSFPRRLNTVGKNWQKLLIVIHGQGPNTKTLQWCFEYQPPCVFQLIFMHDIEPHVAVKYRHLKFHKGTLQTKVNWAADLAWEEFLECWMPCFLAQYLLSLPRTRREKNPPATHRSSLIKLHNHQLGLIHMWSTLEKPFFFHISRKMWKTLDINGRTGEWTDGQMKDWMNERVSEWVNGWMNSVLILGFG